MLAVLYLIIVLLIGDIVCRRFYRFDSAPHRVASAFLVGLLVCTFASYFLALSFAWTSDPLLYSNLLFGFLSLAIIGWVLKNNRSTEFDLAGLRNGFSEDRKDLEFGALALFVSCVLMFWTFSRGDGTLQMSSFLWNDFGPNLSLVQSFAVGLNFPTEYPHFIGEPIRYHFLFWFQAGNLEYLGLNIVWSLNLLSAFTLAAMLVLTATLGNVVFGSKAVGRIGAVLFFFHGSLSFIPFLLSKGSISEAFYYSVNAVEWVKSIYPYAGEQWGVWSMGTFLAQRHLPAAIGIFLVVLIFLISSIRANLIEKSDATEEDAEFPETIVIDGEIADDEVKESTLPPVEPPHHSYQDIASYVFSGVMLGLLPLWNGAIFIAGVTVVGAFLILFPNRVRTLCLLVTSAIVAVPQILYLRAGSGRGIAEIFRWGYVVDPPTIGNVAEYFAFTFGVKTLLALIAVAILSAFHRKLFLAFFSLLVLSFGTQLSTDVMNNHKFINVWLILINLYVAYALFAVAKRGIAGRILAASLFVVIAIGGTIELFRVKNDKVVTVPFNKGPLYDWLYTQTDPRDIFLTDKHIHHPIFLSGRRVFYGWHYFGWSMGYNTSKRDDLLKKLFSEQRLPELLNLLADNDIKYVAIDIGIRNGFLAGTLNETVFEANFEKVFVDRENNYNSLVIYKVPQEPDRLP